jgi:hypothetical protein
MFAITDDNVKQIQLAYLNNSSPITLENTRLRDPTQICGHNYIEHLRYESLRQWSQIRGHNYVERLQY